MKACRYRYKHMRKSTKHRRDAQRFAASKAHIAALHEQEADGALDVFYFDQTGISLTPVVPYAWQPIGKQIRLACQPSENLTVLGFMNKACQFHGFRRDAGRFQGAATAKVVVSCIDEFVEAITKPTVVILDNAASR